MKYIGDLITESRRDTNNTDTTGISTEDFLRYANYAQDRLFGLILQTSPMSFQATKEISLVADQEAYTILDNVYLGERIVMVEYSPTGLTRDYYKIYEVGLSYRDNYPQPRPVNYIRQNGQVLLRPIPSAASGTIRVTYERDLDDVGTRRGQVNGTPSGTTIDLTHGTFGAPSTSDEALFVKDAYICISDGFGNVMLRNGIISSYNAGTDAITLAANASTYLVGSYTLANLADGYLTVGQYTTTHSNLKNPCERYLVAYMNWKILGRDTAGAAKSKVFEAEVELIEKELIQSYQLPDKDEDSIQIENPDLLLQD